MPGTSWRRLERRTPPARPHPLLVPPALHNLFRAKVEDRLDDALRKRLVRSEADRALGGIVAVEHVTQRAQHRLAPDEQRAVPLGCLEAHQRVTIQFEEGLTIAD